MNISDSLTSVTGKGKSSVVSGYSYLGLQMFPVSSSSLEKMYNHNIKLNSPVLKECMVVKVR